MVMPNLVGRCSLLILILDWEIVLPPEMFLVGVSGRLIFRRITPSPSPTPYYKFSENTPDDYYSLR